MDLSPREVGSTPEKEQQPAIEYTAQAASPIVNGEVKITISENSFTATALFDAAEIAFTEIDELILADHVVTVKADVGRYSFSRMGQWAQAFYDALYEAYNKAVLRSLFIKGNPVLTAKGEYRCSENGEIISGSAPVHVYENCVATLPPDLSARRIPLCFVTGMDKGDYELALRLDTGESYTYAKLGYDTAPFADAVEKQIRKLREKSLAAAREIDPSLPAAQASRIARLAPEGAAAPIGQFAAIAPSFVVALEEKLSATRAAESYKAFKELCDPARIYIGFRKNEIGADSGAGAMGGLLGGNASQEGGEAEATAPDPYLLWLIAPSPDGRYAAVEFAEADTATFVYRTAGDFDAFAKQLNRALETISFKREVIRLPDAELRKPENSDYYMAAKRTASLRFVRLNFAGRIIHSSPESWRRKLTELWSGVQANPDLTVPVKTAAKFCGQCGAALNPGVKFCGACGMKIS